MSANAKFSLVALVFFLNGCAGLGQLVSVGQLTSSQVQRLETISIIQAGSINAKDFKVLKRVKGISCNGDGKTHISESEAINQVRLKAALSNADALTNLVCENNQSTDWINNCWKSWVCFADVITLKNGQSIGEGDFALLPKPTLPKIPHPPEKETPQSGSGSGFFVSKMGHVITNAHVVNNCNKVTVGDNANTRVAFLFVTTVAIPLVSYRIAICRLPALLGFCKGNNQ